ncbi:S8 family serine peptidase [Puniceicoccus vermicola]|uniref:S8 family serine peptidase n=1 Tax=Puniceicoccus vermicola TaxID=388746 RepID=A0A7X1B261_9BACT|nr:S8 family serine peptidase [Puniceicoccus vermicola]MBC2604256.1 S8 family serine peptidase [Puniceicoccus vermicola]
MKKKIVALVAAALVVSFFLIFQSSSRDEIVDPSVLQGVGDQGHDKEVASAPLASQEKLTANNASMPSAQPEIGPMAGLLEDAVLLDARDMPTDSDGRFVRKSLYRVKNFSYPNVLVESVMESSIDGETKAVWSSAVVGDHAMIRLPDGATKEDLQEWMSVNGYYLRGQLSTAPVFIVATSSPALNSVDSIVRSFEEAFLAGQPDWDLRGVAEADNIGFFSGTIPDDEDFYIQWALENTGQWSGSTEGADIGATIAWNVGTGSSDVVVAVVDSGVQLDHPDLKENLWTNVYEIPGDGIDNDQNGFIDDVNGWDFVGNSWDPNSSSTAVLKPDNDPSDQNGHGTHVSGIIGARGNNGIGISGVCWKVSIMPLKIGSSGRWISFSAAIDATNYAVSNGAKMINNSFGGFGRPEARNPPILYEDAIRAASNADVLFIAAAGNALLDEPPVDTDQVPYYPSCYDVPNVISVAASDYNDDLASFSNYGASTVDLAAPGDTIYSTYPESSYALISGTSMAAPQVTGALALLKSVSSVNGQGLKSRLLSTVDKLGAFSGAVATGGRLNVQAMLGATEDSDPGDTPVIGGQFSITDVAISDPKSISPYNNGDGFINPGETVVVEYTITNISDTTAYVIYSDIEASPEELYTNIPMGFDSMNFGNRSIGNLQPGQSYRDKNLRFFCYGNTPVPYTGSYSIVLKSGGPSSRTSQSFSFSATASNTVNVSGTVVSSYDPLPNASVILEANGEQFMTTSDSQGRFSIRLPGNTYEIFASVSEFYTGIPFTINAINGASGVKLRVPVSKFSVFPESIEVTVEAGSILTDNSLSLYNYGVAPGEWTAIVSAGSSVAQIDSQESAQSAESLPIFESANWLSVNPSGGLLNAEQMEEIELTFSPDPSVSGIYYASLLVVTDAPIGSELTVPIKMTVTIPSVNGFPAAAYANWLDSQVRNFGGPGNYSLSGFDYDGDGIENMVDFVLGDPSGTEGVSLKSKGDVREFSFNMREDVPLECIQVLYSDDLIEWDVVDSDTNVQNIEESLNEDGSKSVTVEISGQDVSDSRFYRLKITP